MKQDLRILVFLYLFNPFDNANTNAVMPAIKRLAQDYPVDIFTWRADKSTPSEEIIDGLHVYRCDAPFPDLQDKLLGCSNWSPESLHPPFLGLKRLFLRVLRFRPLHRLLFASACIFLTPAQRRMKKRLIQGNYRMLITCSSPITPQYDGLALARRGVFAKKQILWVMYPADPYATSIALTDCQDEWMKIECQMFRHADGIITTPELYEDNKRCPLGDFAEKTYPVPFANLKALTSSATVPFLVPGKINCLYVGSLACLAVRNPAYFYRIAAACPDEFAIHIICYQEDEQNRQLRQQLLLDRPNIFWHSRLPLETCLSAMCQSQILINLGNSCLNQTPSKVFDYMGAGKPIVNFYELEGDTSARYLERYPLKLNIRNKPELDPADSSAFAAFCRESAGKYVDYPTVESLYEDMSVSAVGNLFVHTIDELFQQNPG